MNDKPQTGRGAATSLMILVIIISVWFAVTINAINSTRDEIKQACTEARK